MTMFKPGDIHEFTEGNVFFLFGYYTKCHVNRKCLSHVRQGFNSSCCGFNGGQMTLDPIRTIIKIFVNNNNIQE